MSHHPIDHKMSVVRTLLERSQNLVSEPVSETEWSFQKARRQMKQMKPKKKKKTGSSSDKTFGGDSVCRESFRDSSQDHEKIQCTLCYETMGYSQECLGAPQRS